MFSQNVRSTRTLTRPFVREQIRHVCRNITAHVITWRRNTCHWYGFTSITPCTNDVLLAVVVIRIWLGPHTARRTLLQYLRIILLYNISDPDECTCITICPFVCLFFRHFTSDFFFPNFIAISRIRCPVTRTLTIRVIISLVCVLLFIINVVSTQMCAFSVYAVIIYIT